MLFRLKKILGLLPVVMAVNLSGQETQFSTAGGLQLLAASEIETSQRLGGLGDKRDPFRPFNLSVRQPSTPRREIRSPLERFELGQLKLVAVIWDIKEPTAMVEDSAGLGYVIKVGTPIGVNDGKVKSIQPDRVIVEEYSVEPNGAKKRRDVEMRITVEKSE